MRQNNIEKFQRCKTNTHLNGNGKASPIIIISDKKKIAVSCTHRKDS